METVGKYPPELQVVEIGESEVRVSNHINSERVRWLAMFATVYERRVIGEAFMVKDEKEEEG